MDLIKGIALISIYPPPFGGVSIHAKLLAGELWDRNMLNVLITGGKKNKDDPGYLKRVSNIFIFWHYKIPFLSKLYSKKIKIIHSHEGFSAVPFLFLHRFIFKKQIIHTIHNQWVTEQYKSQNFLKRIIIDIFFKDKNTKWICVNENAYDQMLKLGIKKECISIIPAYFPGKNNSTKNQNDLKIIETITEFKKNHKLIGMYGFRFHFDSKGRDIYGFNFSIDVFKQLIKINPLIKLVFLIPNASPQGNNEKMKLRIEDEGLSANILTIFGYPIINMNLFWDQLDIYFRPTIDDGDSLAIREALENGVTVVASDVCRRPQQTKVFKSLDIDNALKILTEALNNKELFEVTRENYLSKLLTLYECKYQ